MKSLFLFCLFSSTTILADEAAWVQQNGRFASFQTPSTVSRDNNLMGVDSILEIYRSPSLRIAFDSEVTKLPASLQAEFERTLAAWVAQRKDHWSKSTYVENGGAIHGFETAQFPGELPYSLYFGFAVRDKDKPSQHSTQDTELDMNSMHSFAITVHFASLDRLDDVERLLKSMKFKTE